MTAKDISLFVYWTNPKFMFSSFPASYLIPTSLSLSLFDDNSNCNQKQQSLVDCGHVEYFYVNKERKDILKALILTLTRISWYPSTLQILGGVKDIFRFSQTQTRRVKKIWR